MSSAPYRGAAAGLVIAVCSLVFADAWPKRIFGFVIGMGIALYEWNRGKELVARRRALRQVEIEQRQTELDSEDAS